MNLKVIGGLAGLVLLAGITPLLIFNFPQLLGADNAFIVRTDSMEPAIPTGSVIFVRKTAPERINEGDVITFRFNGGPIRITHRVIEIQRIGSEHFFRTRGDANPRADSDWVQEDHLVGKVVLTVPLLGHVLDTLTSPEGLIILILLPSIVLIIHELHQIQIELTRLAENS